jgi:hypothetical protein
MMRAQQELPQYAANSSSLGTLRAVKVAAIEIHDDKSATIAPENRSFSPFRTKAEWAVNFAGSEDDKGYFVQHDDGFASWMPTAEFEAEYTLIASV